MTRLQTIVFFLAGLALAQVALSAQALPFFTNTSLTAGFESNGVRTFSRLVRRDRLEVDGVPTPDPSDAEVFVFAQVFAVPVRLGPGTVLTAAVPLMHRRLTSTPAGLARSRLSTRGWGDLTLTVKQRVLHRDFLGGGVQAAVIGGVKLPTGDDGRTDAQGNLLPRGLQLGSGSVDVPLGIVFTAFKDRVGFNADFVYQFNRQASGFARGDEARFNLALGYRLLPSRYHSVRDKVFNAYLELNTAWSDPARLRDALVGNTGGRVVQLTPGIQTVLSPRFLVEAAFQIPIHQRLNGAQLALAPTVNLGIRLLF